MQRIPHPRASDSNGSRDGAASKIGRFPVFRSCLVYVASFSAAGLNQPYLPVWLTSRGLSESEIALVISTPMVLRLIVTPLFGTLADRAGSHRTVICIMAATAFLLAFALSLAHGFWPILVVATAMLLVWQSIGPIVDASVLQLIRRGIANDFGRIRLWGSASFAAASVLGGFALGWGGPDAVFAAFTSALGFLVVASVFLPVPAPTSAMTNRPKLDLRKRPLLFVVFLSAALVLASQTTFNTFGTVHLRELGYPDRAIGLLWALATCAEIAMFWAGPIVARALGPFGLLVLASCAAVVRWSMMSLNPGIAATALLQLLHAATFSCPYLGLMRFVQATVEEGVGARAQSAFVTVLGLLTAAATLAMGPLYRNLGAGAYQVAALLPMASLLLLLLFRARLRAAVDFGTRTDGAGP